METSKNYINTTNLPKMGGKTGKIAWSKCYNVDVDFRYNAIQGTLKIIKPLDDSKLLISYNDIQVEVQRASIRNCKLAFVVGDKNHNFKYNVNDKIKTKFGFLTILETKKINRKQKYNHKIKNNYRTKGYKVKCSNCKSIFDVVEYRLNSTVICKTCAGRNVKIGFNDINSSQPEIAKLLKNKEDGYKYTANTVRKKLEWSCPSCGETILRTPNEITTHGLHCPKCGKNISYPNRFMYCLLSQININFENERSFNWSQGKKYDFYLPKFSVIIEMHGLQHYEDSTLFTKRTLQKEQENDKLKERLARENNIQNYIVIDCRKSDFNFIKEKVLSSQLSEIINLSKVNWTILLDDVNSSIISKIANMWNNETQDMEIIRKKLNLSSRRAVSLLKYATEMNLCKYDPQISQRIGRTKVQKQRYQRNTPFFCVETGDYFGSTTIATKVLNQKGIHIYRANLEKVLSKQRKHTLNLHFQYTSKQEFNEVKQKKPEKAFGDFFIE